MLRTKNDIKTHEIQEKEGSFISFVSPGKILSPCAELQDITICWK